MISKTDNWDTSSNMGSDLFSIECIYSEWYQQFWRSSNCQFFSGFEFWILYLHIRWDDFFVGIYTTGSRIFRNRFFHRKKYSSFAYVFGILHSFAFKGYALNLFNNLRKDKSYTIWECVIPKGSLYFEGHYYEYGSRKLKLVRKIC